MLEIDVSLDPSSLELMGQISWKSASILLLLILMMILRRNTAFYSLGIHKAGFRKRFASTVVNMIEKDLIRVGEVVCNSGDELERLGSSISRCVDIGDVLLLYGNLGLGKTVLSRGFIRGIFDDPKMRVTSPSYLLDNCYEIDSETQIHHMDLYRLPSNFEPKLLGIPEIFNQSITLIEWPERLGSHFSCPNSLLFRFELIDDSRKVELFAHSSVSSSKISKLQEYFK